MALHGIKMMGAGGPDGEGLRSDVGRSHACALQPWAPSAWIAQPAPPLHVCTLTDD